jgi:hypothetical protein
MPHHSNQTALASSTTTTITTTSKAPHPIMAVSLGSGSKRINPIG